MSCAHKLVTPNFARHFARLHLMNELEKSNMQSLSHKSLINSMHLKFHHFCSIQFLAFINRGSFCKESKMND